MPTFFEFMSTCRDAGARGIGGEADNNLLGIPSRVDQYFSRRGINGRTVVLEDSERACLASAIEYAQNQVIEPASIAAMARRVESVLIYVHHWNNRPPRANAGSRNRPSRYSGTNDSHSPVLK